MLPSKTLVDKDEKSAPGYKRSKKRVTVLLCTNQPGDHKLKPLLIEKAKDPRAFKNLNMVFLSINLKNQKIPWIDSSIFKIVF